MDSSLWYRSFTRGATPDDPTEPALDIDSVADDDFIQKHFTDFFGQWLTQSNNKLIGNLDGLLSQFFNEPAKFRLQTYLVGDGTSIPKAQQTQWFNPHLRFLCVVTPPSSNVVINITPLPWLFFIVGSHRLEDEDVFLQVASWDKTRFRFYQRDDIIGQQKKGWLYQGESNDAFNVATQYLGPFNGHVNGACIMKEIHQPWMHWLSPTDNLANCLSSDDIVAFKKAPYLTKPGSPSILSGATVTTADFLEPLVISGVRAWFKQRQKNDFFDGNGQLLTQPQNVQRWVAHLLLTTTINVAGASNSGFIVPPDHFMDNELLMLDSTFSLTNGMNPPPVFAFSGSMYQTAIEELGLCLMQELDPGAALPPDVFYLPMSTLGEGKVPIVNEIPFMVARSDEGNVPFTILQSSIEDHYGAATMQTLKVGPKLLQLFSEATVNALLMVDFWNPIYSWRRGRLMQYIPTTTTLTENKYDLESNFIAAVTASDAMKDASSPEYAFVQLLSVSVDTLQTRIGVYFSRISKALKTYEGLRDYMKLAESRRRIYRPLPLDEFGFTLPYARKMDPSTPWYEMTEQGTIQPIPPEGVEFLSTWIGNLAGFDPEILHDPSSRDQAVVHPTLLPKPANLPLLCQYSRSPEGTSKSQGCPFLAKRERSIIKSVPAIATLPQSLSTTTNLELNSSNAPTWADDILPLFQSPYWAKSSDTGNYWRDSMLYYGYGPLDLQNSSNVKRDIVTIYEHLRSRSMPIVRSEDEFWPEGALEVLRSWANGGFRITSADPEDRQQIIPAPVDPPAPIRVRQDILSLSKTDLNTYRAKLDDVLSVGVLKSKWQELGLLHAQWCLHYQEGFVLWHRAMLRYVEELIDCGIPYWNGFAADAANPSSPVAGIPACFLEDTYEHPTKGTRPNPLKYALTLDGYNPDTKQKYVVRDPIFVARSKSPGWVSKVALLEKYQNQVVTALSQDSFSHPELADGSAIPWANIPKFLEDMSDDQYAYRTTFDGLFEQAHDNYHGWVGGLSDRNASAGDMSDNTYTAFDPIFFSLHANIDRLATSFMRAHPEQQYTSNFPLQPFIDSGKGVNYTDPRSWIYTTIGDMAKDTMALGYLYAPPYSSDYVPLTRPQQRATIPKGGSAAQIISKADTSSARAYKRCKPEDRKPWVVFPNVACIEESYAIDIFVGDAASTTADHVKNPDYIGRMTRLGMGRGPADGGLKNKQRCHKPTVTRAVSAEGFETQLERVAGELKMVITRVKTGELLSNEEAERLGGFEGKFMWSL